MQKSIKSMGYILLIGLAVLPVILLMIFIYRKDKYQKEPAKSLIKAFVAGVICAPLDILIINWFTPFFEGTAFSYTIFYSSFMEAGIPEEFCKFLMFMILIWDDKNFDEYFDGIVYATFIGLGFACLENIEYVLMFGFQTGIVRALLSVPGHFLFGVIMGYFLSLAKFQKERRFLHIMLALFLAMLAHGLFDWLLMFSSSLSLTWSTIVYFVFLWGDYQLWKIGLRYINKQQENSRIQAGITREAEIKEHLTRKN